MGHTSLVYILFLSSFEFFPIIEAFQRSPNDPLLLVQVVIRHADRAGMSGWATDKSESVFFRGFGELSDDGIDNAYKQGEDFRKRYVDTGFVDARFLPNQVTVRSSSVNRVLMSATSFTSALFNKTDNGHDRIPPIITSYPSEEDPLLVPPIDCLDGWDDVIAKYNLSTPTATDVRPIGQPTNQHSQALIKMMKTEYPVDCADVPEMLIESVVAEMPNKKISMPPAYVKCAQGGAKKLMFDYIGMLAGAGPNYNKDRLKRTAGMLMGVMLDNMAKVMNCSTNATCEEPKMRIYFTHDITVMAVSQIMGAISLFNEKTPAFSAAIVIELRNSPFGPYVSVFLKNGQDAPFLETDGCSKTNCTLDSIIEATKEFAIRDKPHCRKTDNSASVYFSSLLFIVLAVLLRLD